MRRVRVRRGSLGRRSGDVPRPYSPGLSYAKSRTPSVIVAACGRVQCYPPAATRRQPNRPGAAASSATNLQQRRVTRRSTGCVRRMRSAKSPAAKARQWEARAPTVGGLTQTDHASLLPSTPATHGQALMAAVANTEAAPPMSAAPPRCAPDLPVTSEASRPTRSCHCSPMASGRAVSALGYIRTCSRKAMCLRRPQSPERLQRQAQHPHKSPPNRHRHRPLWLRRTSAPRRRRDRPRCRSRRWSPARRRFETRRHPPGHHRQQGFPPTGRTTSKRSGSSLVCATSAPI